MRHTLIERNEPDDDSSLSGSRDSLVDPEPIDMLKMHTVIQRFCSDSLNASKRLPAWLNHACQLFICSYHEADTRIRSRHEPARVSDYRQYSIHGEQLRQHTVNYASKKQPLLSIRLQLDNTLADVRERIRSMEPRSSQESVVQKEFQCSIFDRTNTSSSSSNSQTDGSSPVHSSLRLISPEGDSLDPASRRESESSDASKAITSDQPSNAPADVRDDSNTVTPVSNSNELRVSQPMLRNPSNTSTIRPNESKQNSYSGVGKLKPPPPLATLSTEAAVGSMFKSQQQSSADMDSSRSALSSLTNVQRPNYQSSAKPRSFWSRTFSHPHLKPTIPRGQSERNDLVASQATRPHITSGTASDPAQRGYTSPTGGSTLARGRSDQQTSGQSRVSSRSPIRSDVLLSKSLAAPMVSPVYDARYWESLVPAQGQSTKAIVSPTIALLPTSSSLQTSQPSFQQPVVLESSPQSQTSRAGISVGPSGPVWQIQGQVLPQTIAHVSTSHVPSAVMEQSNGMSTITTTLDGNVHQLSLNEPIRYQASTTEQATPKPMLPSPRQSPRIEPIKVYESPHLKHLDGSSNRKPSDFASTNSSPTIPPRMFSSINSDDTVNTEQKPHQNVSAMVSSSSNWAEAPQQVLRPQIHSAPLVYSQFSPSIATTNSPSLSTSTTTAGLTTSSIAEVPLGFVTQRSGLGITEFPDPIPVTGVAIVPASDPRRRLRAREGRLTERDVNVLVRQPSEVDHPLAPKDEPAAPDTNPTVLTLNGPDGQTILASTDLKNWKPVERNVGTRSSAPYPETNRIPTGGSALSVGDLLIDIESNHKRRRSAPESPGWGGGGDSAGWLGQA